MVDQSPLSVAMFALVFGATFLVTAPLTVVFVSESFGTRHLGALTGLITMVHQIFGGIGAYLGAAVFDATGTYDTAFKTMLAVSLLAVLLTLPLRQPRRVVARLEFQRLPGPARQQIVQVERVVYICKPPSGFFGHISLGRSQ